MQENQSYYFLRCPYGDILCGLLFLGRDRFDCLGPIVCSCSQHAPLHRNYEGALNDSLAQYKAYIETYIADLSSSALAPVTIIWGWSGAGETDSGLEYMQRVLAHSEVLTVESLVQNVTMPFFAVNKFEWIQDYETELNRRARRQSLR